MSRLKFNSTKGVNEKMHNFGKEVSRARTEKLPVSERSVRMFQHKPFTTDMRGVADVRI